MFKHDAAVTVKYQTHFISACCLSLLSVISTISALGYSGRAYSAEVGLEWDRVVDDRVAYYEVHYGTQSGDYDWSEISTSTSTRVAGLSVGSTYYFAARACPGGGPPCSDFSNEVSTTVAGSIENSAPVANAGADQTVLIGAAVVLDGSGSTDVDGDALTFSWSLTSPAGSAAVLYDPTAVKPTFLVDVPGDYVAQLIVNDGLVDSTPDTVTVSIENSAPVANAGADQTVLVGATVGLDGSGSIDVDGDALSFRWSLTPPAGSTAVLYDPTAVKPTFEVDVPGDYVAQVIVNDGLVNSAPDTSNVNVTSAALAVESVTPNVMNVNTTATVSIAGSGFMAGASVSLTNGAGPGPMVSGVDVQDSSSLTAQVQIKSGGPPRIRYWDVVVTNPNGAISVLPAGFSVAP